MFFLSPVITLHFTAANSVSALVHSTNESLRGKGPLSSENTQFDFSLQDFCSANTAVRGLLGRYLDSTRNVKCNWLKRRNWASLIANEQGINQSRGKKKSLRQSRMFSESVGVSSTKCYGAASLIFENWIDWSFTLLYKQLHQRFYQIVVNNVIEKMLVNCQ